MSNFWRPFRTLPRLDQWLIAGAVVVMLAVVVETVLSIAEDDRDPITIHNVETLNSPLVPGDFVVVRVYRTKVRDCALTSYRRAVSEDGVVYQLGTASLESGGEVGTDFVDVSYPTNPNMPLGAYQLRVTLTYLCPDGPHVIEQPPALFRFRAGDAK